MVLPFGFPGPEQLTGEHGHVGRTHDHRGRRGDHPVGHGIEQVLGIPGADCHRLLRSDYRRERKLLGYLDFGPLTGIRHRYSVLCPALQK